jgi:hypothetical protein
MARVALPGVRCGTELWEMRNTHVFAALLLIMGCRADSARTNTQSGAQSPLNAADSPRTAAVVSSAPANAAPGNNAPPDTAAAKRATTGAARADSVPSRFVIEADSFLRARLAKLTYTAGPSAHPLLEECYPMDAGLPPAFVATRLRVLRDTVGHVSSERNSDNNELSYLAPFVVEITSVATLRQEDEQDLAQRYDVTVEPHTDTAEMLVSRNQTSGKWSVCQPLRYRDGMPLNPWWFVQEGDTSVHAIKWDPPSMSWSSLGRLAREAGNP